MRVMVADDSIMLCEGLVRLLTEYDVEVIGTAGTADKLLVLVADRMSPSSTSECHRPTPTSVCGRHCPYAPSMGGAGPLPGCGSPTDHAAPRRVGIRRRLPAEGPGKQGLDKSAGYTCKETVELFGDGI
jgi:hypothetical protein